MSACVSYGKPNKTMQENIEKIDVWTIDGKNISDPTPITICGSHTKDSWMKHEGYTQNKDGSVTCLFCPWGTHIPGYMRVIQGKVVDLRRAEG